MHTKPALKAPDHDDDHGPQLAHDLGTMTRAAAARRQALRWLSAGALSAGAPVILAACGGGGDTTTSSSSSSSGTSSSSSSSSSSTTTTTTTTGTSSSSSTTTSSSGTCSTIPDETNGPYPADGTNQISGSTVNVLTQSGVVRSDIRSSFGSLSGTASGVPLTLTLKLVNSAASCASLEGLAVYIWHCTADGNYSLYSSGFTNQNFLRGVQVTDANGLVSFTTVFPGCYSGRWPHIHFEVYRSLATATSAASDIKTSQVALPEDACSAVYSGATGYGNSTRNLNAITLATDSVFGNDSAAHQMATVTGSVSAGYIAALTVGVAV